MRLAINAEGKENKDEVAEYIRTHIPAARRCEVFDAYKGSRNWKNPF